MSGTFGGVRATGATVGSALGAVAVSVGLVLGSAVVAQADPAATPTPTPAPVSTPASTPQPASNVASAPVTAANAPSAPAAQTTATVNGAAVPIAKPTTPAAPDVLDALAEEYAVGSGGGQLSNLLKNVLKLRAMGFKPSKQYLDEIQTAMSYRPNQLPLIDALKDTIAYQQKLKAQMEILTKAQAAQQNGAVMGAGAAPGAANPANLAPQAAAGAPQPAAGAPPVIVAPTP